MRARRAVAYTCSHCQTALQPGGEAEIVGERELLVACPACGTRSRVPLGGFRPDDRTGEGTGVVVGEEPTFRDLVSGSDAPPFPLRPEPGDAPVRKPTLADRWNAMSPRRQKCVVAGAVLAVLAAGVLWPNATAGNPLRPRPSEPLAEPFKNPPPQFIIPAHPLRKYLVTTRPIPLNTEITPANAAEYFTDAAVESAPPGAGAVGADDRGRLVGLHAQRDLPAGQFVTAQMFGPASIAPTPQEWKPERFVVRVWGASGVTEYVYETRRGETRLVEVRPLNPFGAKPHPDDTRR